MLPSGTVTFLFTDVEGSTAALERHGERMQHALARHHELLLAAVERHDGVVFETVGDAVYAAFARAGDAVAAAVDLQIGLHTEPWGDLPPIRVRAAVHTGDVEVRGDHYVGATLFRCARLQALAHGGQTLLSGVTERLVAGGLPAETRAIDLGAHRLKDLGEPEHVFQLAHPALPDVFPPLHSLDAHPHNLPLQLTSFIGRERELAAVEALLRDHRLVTLTGPGGSGKTRLALQAAADAIDRHPDGVYFVDLGDLADASLVPQATAGALGVQAGSAGDTERAVMDHLARRSLVLVLDNFEHLGAAAPLVARILAAAPGVHVLATSRAPLHVRGEQEYALAPLPVPEAGSRPTAASVSQYDAVSLFIERAVAVSPAFTVTNETAPAVAEICSRLDGLPLAIELAAARMKALSPDELLRRLGRSLPLLTGGGRDVPDRQRTLRATIAWSHDVLEPSEQLLFARLAVFAGGFTLESAEAVCGDDGRDVLDGVASLVDKSLVQVREGRSGKRFAVLETIREFASERLEALGETEALRERHADHFLALAEAFGPRLEVAEAATAIDRLEDDHDNLRSMLAFVDATDETRLVRASAALALFWRTQGHYVDMDRWIERAGSTAAARQTGAGADVLHALAANRVRHGRGDEALELYRELLAIRRAAGDRIAEGYVLNNIAQIQWSQGDLAGARQALEDAVAIHAQTPGRYRRGTPMSNLAEIAFAQGDEGRAAELFDRVFEIEDRDGSALPGLPHAMRSWLAIAVGDHDRARSEFETARRLGAGMHNPLKASGLATLEAALAIADGRLDDAHALITRALRVVAGLDAFDSLADALDVAAMVATSDGRYADAARLFGSSSAFRASVGDRRHAYADRVWNRTVATARAGLGDAAFDAGFAAGGQMSRADAERLATTRQAPG